MFGTRKSIVNPVGRLRFTAPRALSRLLAATLFPPRCCLCGFWGASADLDLCNFCHADLPWIAHAPSDFMVPLRFEHPVDDMIRRLKYHGAVEHARVFGTVLAEAARGRATAPPRSLVPVPLHPARPVARGVCH